MIARFGVIDGAKFPIPVNAVRLDLQRRGIRTIDLSDEDVLAIYWEDKITK